VAPPAVTMSQRPWIDVQEFVASVTSITLVLNFNKVPVYRIAARPDAVKGATISGNVECFDKRAWNSRKSIGYWSRYGRAVREAIGCPSQQERRI